MYDCCVILLLQPSLSHWPSLQTTLPPYYSSCQKGAWKTHKPSCVSPELQALLDPEEEFLRKHAPGDFKVCLSSVNVWPE